MSRITLSATLVHMADNDVMGWVDSGQLAQIKQTDSSPEIRVFSIGHEGVAESQTGHQYGVRFWNYVKQAIQSIGDRVNFSTPIYHGHPKKGMSGAREIVGTVVGKTMRMIDNTLNSLVAVYVKPEHRDKDFNVSSIEADVLFSLDDDGVARVDKVETVTGIALGNSAVDKPGFPGATMLATIHAFSNNKGIVNMNINEVRDYIKTNDVSVRQLFSEEQLAADVTVKKLVDAAKHDAENFGKRKGDELETLKTQFDDQTKQLEKYRSAYGTMRAGDLFPEIAKDRKLDAVAQKYIKSRMPQFKTDTDDEKKVRKDFENFIDKTMESFKVDAEILGVKLPGQDGKDTAGDIPKETAGGGGSGGDYSKPENNPFILGK